MLIWAAVSVNWAYPIADNTVIRFRFDRLGGPIHDISQSKATSSGANRDGKGAPTEKNKKKNKDGKGVECDISEVQPCVEVFGRGEVDWGD